MDWRVVSGALAVLLLGLLSAFWVVIEGRDAAQLDTLEARHDWLVEQHLLLRDRVRTVEQKVPALRVEVENISEPSESLSSP